MSARRSELHILYVPGLGDHYDGLRRRCLGWWKLLGVTTELVPMQWADGRPYEEKFDRLAQAMAAVKDKKIVLIGESAGGSMVVNMYAAHPDAMYRAMTVCGKNTTPDNVASYLYAKNPAFETSLRRTTSSIAKMSHHHLHEFVSIRPLYDPTVPVRDTLLPYCRQVRLWSVGHFVPIVWALTGDAWRVVRAIR